MQVAGECSGVCKQTSMHDASLTCRLARVQVACERSGVCKQTLMHDASLACCLARMQVDCERSGMCKQTLMRDARLACHLAACRLLANSSGLCKQTLIEQSSNGVWVAHKGAHTGKPIRNHDQSLACHHMCQSRKQTNACNIAALPACAVTRLCIVTRLQAAHSCDNAG